MTFAFVSACRSLLATFPPLNSNLEDKSCSAIIGNSPANVRGAS